MVIPLQRIRRGRTCDTHSRIGSSCITILGQQIHQLKAVLIIAGLVKRKFPPQIRLGHEPTEETREKINQHGNIYGNDVHAVSFSAF